MKIKTTLLGAFAYTYYYRKELLQRLLLPLLILIIISALLQASGNGLLKAISILITLLVFCLIAISTHRVILLGPESVPKWGLYLPKAREFTFLVYTIATGLLMIPIALLPSFIPVLGMIIAAVLVFYFLGRWSLVFPAIATDHNWSLASSWNATKDHPLDMMVVVGIFPFLIGIPENLLAMIPYTGFLTSILSVITMVLTIAALSVAFKTITVEEEN